MRSGRPSDQQLRRSFESVLGDVSAGRGVRTATGLDEETEEALWVIARAYPDVTEELVESARRAFAGQLDGSNAARWHVELARKIAERRAAEEG
ncbi:hypothetical protein HLB23_18670 [Nocardia uniformis]|uniref:Uncharacterized protein n=1 Tax=Nocardia uniformis TaxID=53432 RepID=A0A849C2B2_9NOCA|nr:hypothetical protein [Nocardia uniformis]NNH71858.1 hypothetical protein [Nocardia uniformis]